MNKMLLFAAIALFHGVQLMGNVPVKRPSLTHRQTDGTTVRVAVVGNADYGYYVTPDGLALLPDGSGNLCYTILGADGLANTGIPAHEAALRTAGELDAFAPATAEAASRLFSARYATGSRALRAAASTSDGLGQLGTPGGGVVSSIGAPVIPVIMAEFADLQFQSTTTTEKFTRFLNEEGYADEQYCVGSVRDYFTAQSSGLFTPTFQVVAKVRLSADHAYYGQNSASGSNDVNKYVFVQEALDSAVRAGVDFSQYAAADGAVPNVSIFYAGPGEHSAYEQGCEDYLWAQFSTHAFTAGGVSISSYFVGNELLQSYVAADGTVEYSDPDTRNWPIPQSAQLDGIGVFCHEFGHAIGLPDFYYTGSNQTVYDTLHTMGYWSVMDYGQYMYDGYAPIGYTAYERSMMGWLDVVTLTDAQIATLYAFDDDTDGAKAYCLRNDENTSEYYLLENRQPATWYPARMGSGMLITHVDYNASAWRNGTVNNTPAHQRYAYVPADGEKSNAFSSIKADLYPGTTGTTAFTDTTSPASTTFTTSGLLGKPLYGITESDGVITFCFLDEQLTGLSPIAAGTAATGPVAIYTPDGRRVAEGSTDTSRLKPGVYIVRTNGQTQKVLVK